MACRDSFPATRLPGKPSLHSTSMDFDEVLSELGDLGRYQLILFAFLCVPASLPPAISLLSHIFTSAVPGHRCRSGATAEKVSLLNRSLTASEDHKQALNSLSIPRDSHGNFEGCRQYDVDVDSVIDQVVRQHEHINISVIDKFVAKSHWPTIQCRYGVDFDTDIYPETLATKFGVVCEQEWLSSAAQSAFFVGGVIGCVGLGWISDKWGRKPAFVLVSLATMIGNIAEIYPPDYYTYIVMRFVVGLSYPSIYQLAFMIVAEVIGFTKRTSSSMVCGIAFAFGMMIYASIAKFITDWQVLQAVTSLPLLFLFVYFWLVPESPRWLMSQGRVEEAEKIVQRIAKVNGVQLPPNYLQNKLVEDQPTMPACKEDPTQIGITVLFRYPRVARKILIISFVWTVAAMGYNGYSLAVADLTSEAWFVVFLSGLAEIPGILVAWYTMEHYGRKSTMMGGLILGGICSIATAFVPHGLPWLTVLCPTLAKMAVSSTFTVMYMFASELFPTVIRGFAIGLASTASQVGLVVTPYILFLGPLYGKGIPFVILGVISVLAALLMLSLPETLNGSLPTTMQEAEDYQTFKRVSTKRRTLRMTIRRAETNAAHELR